MVKTIAIIGAGGAMGKWFSEYFLKKGFEGTGFDNTNPIATNIKDQNKLDIIRQNMKKNYNKNVYADIENQLKEFI